MILEIGLIILVYGTIFYAIGYLIGRIWYR
jgi:hypothetical protein